MNNHGGSSQKVKAPDCGSGKCEFESRLSPEDLHWLAGLLEGEGSFIVKPAIQLQMTDRDVVERTARLFDREYYFVSRQKPHHKDSYKTVLYGDPAAELMNALRPLMGERRKAQIEAALLNHGLRKAAMRRIDVAEVRLRLSNGETVAEVAKELGFDRCSIHRRLRNI